MNNIPENYGRNQEEQYNDRSIQGIGSDINKELLVKEIPRIFQK